LKTELLSELGIAVNDKKFNKISDLRDLLIYRRMHGGINKPNSTDKNAGSKKFICDLSDFNKIGPHKSNFFYRIYIPDNPGDQNGILDKPGRISRISKLQKLYKNSHPDNIDSSDDTKFDFGSECNSVETDR
jgi:hypothetical protein